MRPNEQFSASVHARPLCKDCSRLGASELRFRQDLRNLERLVTSEGIIGRKKRKTFNRFLEHHDPRIRWYAEKLAARDIEARALPRFYEDEDYCEPKNDHIQFEGATAGASQEDACSPNEIIGPGDDDIPF